MVALAKDLVSVLPLEGSSNAGLTREGQPLVLHAEKDAEGTLRAGTPLINLRGHRREDHLSWDSRLKPEEE